MKLSSGSGPGPRSDVEFMRCALELAAQAQANAEVPVGAVLVHGGAIVAGGANSPISSHDPTAHAEIMALRAAALALRNYRLSDTTLYVTLEPCIMCAAAIVHARVRRLVFGAWDQRAGAAGSIINVFTLPSLNHRVDVFGGVLSEECAAQLDRFFSARRTTTAI
jgi:tRNA(adenine34) deaminase